MRRVSGEMRSRRKRRRRGAAPSPTRSGSDAPWAPAAGSCVGSAGAVPGAAASVFAIAITDAIERFDLCEIVVDRLELFSEPLDVAVDGAVVDIDVLAIGCLLYTSP